MLINVIIFGKIVQENYGPTCTILRQHPPTELATSISFSAVIRSQFTITFTPSLLVNAKTNNLDFMSRLQPRLESEGEVTSDIPDL